MTGSCKYYYRYTLVSSFSPSFVSPSPFSESESKAPAFSSRSSRESSSNYRRNTLRIKSDSYWWSRAFKKVSSVSQAMKALSIDRNNITRKTGNFFKISRNTSRLTPQWISFWFIRFAASWLLPVRVTASGSSEIKLGCPGETIFTTKDDEVYAIISSSNE